MKNQSNAARVRARSKIQYLAPPRLCLYTHAPINPSYFDEARVYTLTKKKHKARYIHIYNSAYIASDIRSSNYRLALELVGQLISGWCVRSLSSFSFSHAFPPTGVVWCTCIHLYGSARYIRERTDDTLTLLDEDPARYIASGEKEKFSGTIVHCTYICMYIYFTARACGSLSRE